MNKLNKYRIVFVVHLIFIFAAAALTDIDVFTDHNFKLVNLFGVQLPSDFFFVPAFWLLLLILIIVSWRGAVDAPSERLRNYFRSFRWAGINMLVMTFIIWTILICGEIHTNHIMLGK